LKQTNTESYLLTLIVFLFAGVFACSNTIAQDTVAQKDIIDILLTVIGKDPSKRQVVSDNRKGKLHLSGSPAIEYSAQTGLAYNITGNVAFYTADHSDANISSILVAPMFTQKQQFIVPVQSSIWTKGNKYNFIGDWRFLKYPEDTYGLGGYTKADDGYKLDYNYVRFYQFALRKISNDFYAGIGYQLDNHYNIREVIPVGTATTDFQRYGFSTSSRSSGLSIDFLFDNRRNSINPDHGFYGNIVLRQNMQWLGSDENYNSLLVDIRKYFHPVSGSRNILAIWSYNLFTLSGHPPYLDLPSTGWDTYSNTGRGYVQSRFRSRNMVDLETEYRFGISRNGLIGGVVFANVQSYSEMATNRFEVIQPGYGAGLRIKFNKFSRTNVCIDYGFGAHGSSGLFLNLGEVF
jgi:hypothetical protein